MNEMTPDRLHDVMSCIPPDWMGMRRLVFEAIAAWRLDRADLEVKDKSLVELYLIVNALKDELEELRPISTEE